MSLTDALHALLVAYTSNEWLCWGLGLSLAAPVVVLSTALALEWVVAQSWVQPYLIVYGDSETRSDNVGKVQKTIPWTEQLWGTMKTTLGPANMGAMVLNRYIFGGLYGLPEDPLPELSEFVLHFIVLALVADFFLYWGHRIQHESTYLWENFHSYHHQLRTPTPVSVAFIDDVDAILQAGIPIMACGVIVGPHPVTYVAYIAFHLANNVYNHSGIDCLLFNILTLKVLPFRVDNRHHDSHHRFSNYPGPHVKNHAEMFWIWDVVFGTYSDTKKLARTEGQRAKKGSSVARPEG